MSDIFSSVGTQVSASTTAPTTYDDTGFEALTFSLVGELSELPAYGTEAALATHTPLATGIVAKRRGSINYGSVSLSLAVSETDTGQGVLRAAAEAGAGADALVSIKVLFANGDAEYFTAQVMSFKTNVANADAITMAECMLEIDNQVIRVPA